MALDRQCKIVLIGDGSVGKSSLIARFRTEGFAPRYHQTVGVDFFEKRLRLRGAQGVRLQIWDIGGQSISSQMLPKYLYRSQVVLIVYDLTSFSSLGSTRPIPIDRSSLFVSINCFPAVVRLS